MFLLVGRGAQWQYLLWRGSKNCMVRDHLCMYYVITFLGLCCIRCSKKSPNQETGLGNKGRLKVLYDTKLVIKMIMSVPLNHLRSIWYHSEVPYSPNHFLGLDFFCRFLQQDSSNSRPSLSWLVICISQSLRTICCL